MKTYTVEIVDSKTNEVLKVFGPMSKREADELVNGNRWLPQESNERFFMRSVKVGGRAAVAS